MILTDAEPGHVTVFRRTGITLGNVAFLILSAIPVSLFARDSAVQEMGNVIGTICPQIQDVTAEQAETYALRRDCNALGNAIANEDPQADIALRAIAPDQAGAPIVVGRQSLSTQLQNISARMAALRRRNLAAFAGFNVRIGQNVIPVQEPSVRSGMGAGEDDDFVSALNVFLNGEMRFGDRNETAREEGYDFDSQGISLGADYRVKDNLTVGTALGFSRSSSDFSSGGSLDTTGLFITLFSTYHHDTLYVDAGVSFGNNSNKQDRNIRYSLSDGTDVDQTASVEFDGAEFSLFVNTGMEFALPERFFITPGIRFEYLQSEVDGYTEENFSQAGDRGEGWRLTLDEQESTGFLAALGVQASKLIDGKHSIWLPYAGVEWIQDLKAEKSRITGRFLGDPSEEKFELPIDAPDDEYFKLDLGTTLIMRGGKSAFIEYSSLQSVRHHSIGSVKGGFRWEF